LERLDARADPDHPHSFYTMNVQIYLPSWQEMRGVFELPHSCGKYSEVAVFTTDPQVAEAAYQAGAKYAGDIRDDIRNQRILPQDFKILITTKGLRYEVNTIADQFVRILLRHRRRRPAVWNQTFVEPERIAEATWKHTHGYYTTLQVATTQKKRIISTPIGRVGMDHECVLQNFEAVLHQIMAKKPIPTPKQYHGRWENREPVPDSEFIIKVFIGMINLRSYLVDFRPILMDMGYMDPSPRQLRRARLRQRKILEEQSYEELMVNKIAEANANRRVSEGSEIPYEMNHSIFKSSEAQ
jgi:ribosomal protein L1